MNNRFKFRAWNKEKNIMCYDNEDDSDGYFDGIYGTYVGCINLWLKSTDKYIYMQCTGLKDKNGTLIYEGDILEYRFGSVEKDSMFAFVSWSDHMFIAMNDTLSRGTWLPKWAEDSFVVGNIYENPELINSET